MMMMFMMIMIHRRKRETAVQVHRWLAEQARYPRHGTVATLALPAAAVQPCHAMLTSEQRLEGSG